MILAPEDSESFTDLLDILLRIAAGIEAIAEAKGETKPDIWRVDPATKKQKEFMSKHGIPFEESISKDQASILMDIQLANQKQGG